MSQSLHDLGIAELQTRLRAKNLSPVDLVEWCLARIGALNHRLNAFITVLADQAREQAGIAESELRRGTWRGPLHGIPVGVKDFFDTAGVPTTAAFEPFMHRVPAKDADAVARLKAAGAIIIGKMNMHRLGMGTTGLDSAFGPVRNPWNDHYIPGGSSSGSAAAVAAGICWATLDTDAIGSCRLPAACCGVIGFKGTYGAVSSKGILEGEKADPAIVWLSHPAITARSVDDAAIVFDALAEHRNAGAQRNDQPLRIGAADNFKADEEIAGAFDAAVETIRRFGGEVSSAAAPFDLPQFGDLSSMGGDRATIADRAFAAIDLLVLPTTATTVLPVDAARESPQALSAANTMFANYFGLPAVSVPCGFDRRGLPIGLQIVGAPWRDTIFFDSPGGFRRPPLAPAVAPLP